MKCKDCGNYSDQDKCHPDCDPDLLSEASETMTCYTEGWEMYKMEFETAPYEKLCGCVSVITSHADNLYLDRMEKAGKRKEAMRALFNSDRVRLYSSDCTKCENGMRLSV